MRSVFPEDAFSLRRAQRQSLHRMADYVMQITPANLLPRWTNDKGEQTAMKQGGGRGVLSCPPAKRAKDNRALGAVPQVRG